MDNPIRIISILLYVCLVMPVVSQAQWIQTAGPNGGYVDDLVKVGNTLVLAAQAGGVFRSIDNGGSWESSNSGLPNNPHIYSMYMDDNTVYVALYNGGVYKSTDECINWVPANIGLEHATFYSLFVENSNIYAGAANGGIKYSPDNGASWFDKSAGIAHIQFQDFISYNSNVYAAGDFLYGTNDNGDTWTIIDIPGLSPNGVRAMTVNNGVFYAASDGEVFISEDNLTSWDKANLNTFATIVSMESYGGTVYATTSNGRYFYTNDTGETWTLVQNQNTESFANRILLSEDKIIMTTGQGVYQSPDNGNSWILNNTGLRALNISELASNSNYIFAGTAGQGIARLDNNGDTWQVVNVDNGVLDASFINGIITMDDRVYIATSGGIYVSQDDGANWTRKFDPGINKATESLAYDNGIFATVINGTGVFLSYDSAETWIPASTDGFNTETSYRDLLIKGDTLLVSTDNGELFTSKDQGTTWEDISIQDGFYLTYNIEYSDQILYAATAQGLFTSLDFGLSWKRSPTYGYNSVQDIIIDGEVIYGATDAGMQISELGRDFWYPVTEGMGPAYVNKILLHEETLFVGTYSSSVWNRPKAEMTVPPLDDDFDGVSNVDDLCPNTAPDAEVNSMGCAASQLDDDNDGITNDIDVLCPNTAEGVIVNAQGCDLIAADAIKIYSQTPNCPETANGQIVISSSLAGYVFNIFVSSNGNDENYLGNTLAENLILEDLAAGNYEIAIRIPEIFYEQKYGVTLNGTDAISAGKQQIDPVNNSISYIVSGSKEYKVQLNGNLQTFNFDSSLENEIKVVGLKDYNTVLISGKNDCQGTITDTFSLTDNIQLYPTFTTGKVYISEETNHVEASVYNQAGQLVVHEHLEIGKEKSLDLTHFTQGLYIVHLKTPEKTTIFKIVRQ
jgi:photosystem II stability/assembly factor-like uncharacterized protein